MTPDIEQMLSAILADLDKAAGELSALTAHMVLVEENITAATDTIEATRISLGALRGVVQEVAS